MKKIGCVGHGCDKCSNREKELSLLREIEKVMRQIADRKRRTMEQRLASSCLTFVDALRRDIAV